MPDAANVKAVAETASYHMGEIIAMFKPGAKITLLVRRDGEPEQDFLLTDDSLDDVIAALERRKAAGPTP